MKHYIALIIMIALALFQVAFFPNPISVFFSGMIIGIFVAQIINMVTKS